MKEFAVRGEKLEMVAQALLTMRSNARSVESTAQSILPLSLDIETVKSLEKVASLADNAAEIAYDLYQKVAPKAFTLDTKE